MATGEFFANFCHFASDNTISTSFYRGQFQQRHFETKLLKQKSQDSQNIWKPNHRKGLRKTLLLTEERLQKIELFFLPLQS